MWLVVSSVSPESCEFVSSVVFRGPERPRPCKPKWASLPFWFMVLCYLPTNTVSADAMECASSHPGEAPVLVAAPAPASAVPLKRETAFAARQWRGPGRHGAAYELQQYASLAAPSLLAPL